MLCGNRVLLATAALWLSACTSDFGVFDFAAGDGGMTPSPETSDARTPEDVDGTDPMPDADAPNAGSGGSGSDAGDAGSQEPDASGSGGDGGRGDGGDIDAGDGGAPPQDAARPEDAETPEDAATPQDAEAEEDADIPPVDTCNARWEGAGLIANECATCACDECAPAVDACLSTGSPTARARCAAVLECAIENDCKDWTCYCTSPSCGSPSASGNGPCAAQMDAAASGARNAVMAIREAGDPNQPLVRAMNSIACVLGLDSRSPGGPRLGECDAFCP